MKCKSILILVIILINTTLSAAVCSAIFPGNQSFATNGSSSINNQAECNDNTCSAPPTFTSVSTLPGITASGAFTQTTISDGTYQHTTWGLGNAANITFSGTGTAVIYFSGNVSIPKDTRLNKNGSPDNLLIIVYGNLSIAKKAKINAYFYVVGTTTLAKSVDINGAISTGGNLSVAKSGEYNFTSSNLNNLNPHGFCSGTSVPTLVAHYAMDEVSWGSVLDSTSGFNGIAYNGANTVGNSCRYGQFDGVNDYVQIPHNDALNGSTDLTYVAYIRPDSWSGTNLIMAKSVHGGGSGRAQMGIFSEGGVLKGRVETLAGRYEIQAPLPAVAGDWIQVALVFNGTSLTLYQNGVSIAATSFTSTTLVQTTDPLNISKRVGTSQYYFHGLIDDVRVYTSALSAAEVLNLYNTVTPCILVSVDHFEITHDGSGSTCASETVTIRACTDAACTSLVGGLINLDLQLNGITNATTSFTGSTTATISHFIAETVAISAVSSTTTPTNGLVCVNGTSSSCNMIFSSAGCAAATGSCSTFFPDTAQGNSVGSQLKFKDSGMIINDSNNSLTFPSLNNSSAVGTNTCNTANCTISSSTAPALTLPAFTTTATTTDITVNSGTSTIGPGGNFPITEVNNLSVIGSANVTFSAGSSTYVINNGFFDGTPQITFNPGIYWFNELAIIGSTNILINGPVTIFVNGQINHLDIEDNVTINTTGAASDLAIVSYTKIHFKNNVKVNAAIYGAGSEVKIEDYAQLTGAVSASGILKIENNGTITAANVNGIQVGNLCGGSTATLDHILLSHDGSALTCSDETITLTACADASCSSVATSDVAVTLATTGSTSTWSSNPVTIPANSSSGVTVSLTHRTAETITFSASASPAATNALVCSPVGCNLTFSDSGYILSLPNHNSCSASTQLTLQAVKLSNTGTTCAPAYTGNQSVNFSYTYDNPITGTVVPILAATNMAAATVVQSRIINFDTTASAALNFQYRDAGQLTVTVADAANAGLSSASVTTIVTPPKLNISTSDTNNACTGPDYGSCTRFKTAGTLASAASQFNLTIEGACADDTVTPNFQLNTIPLTSNLVAPIAGSNGTLGDGSVDITSGGTVTVTQSVSEVGAFSITATPPNYMGQAIPAATSTTIGRFYPDRFIVTDNTPLLSDSTCDFSYQGQDINFATGLYPVLTVTAVNSAGTTTVNYGGDGAANNDFWKLDSAILASRSYTNTVVAYPGTLSSTLGATTTAGETNYDGVNTFTFDTDQLNYGKSAAVPVATSDTPFDAALTLNLAAALLTDSDGVFFDSDNNGVADAYTSSSITGTNVRWGRWFMENVFGSEQQPLILIAQAQYFDGTNFIISTTDTCSTTLTPSLSSYTSNLALGETTLSQGTMSSGLVPLTLSAPGVSNDGAVQVTLTAPNWLTYDFTGDGTADSATAIASFGIFEGRKPIILQRQTY